MKKKLITDHLIVDWFLDETLWIFINNNRFLEEKFDVSIFVHLIMLWLVARKEDFQ